MLKQRQTFNVFFVFFRFPGKALIGKKYKPLFEYFAKVSSLCSCSAVHSFMYRLPQIEDRPMTHFNYLSEHKLAPQFMFSKSVRESLPIYHDLWLHFFGFLHLILFLLVSLQCGEKGAFQVVTDNYVKEEEGTGVVHQAPYFGAVSVVFLICALFYLEIHL